MENTTAIYLRFGKKLKIPVNPETIEIKYPSNDKEYDVLGVGQGYSAAPARSERRFHGNLSFRETVPHRMSIRRAGSLGSM